MNLEKDISNKIYWGKFICSVTVIAIHSVNNNIKGILYNVEYIIRDYVLCFAVPFFFILSGFLFYYGIENETFFYKWKKRLKKQLYLYILWNLFFTLVHTIYVTVRNTGIAFSILGQSMAESSVSLKGFWEGVLLHKYNGHWWFMLQLTIMIIVAPLIWQMAQRKISLIILIMFFVMLAFLQGLEWIKAPYIVFYSFVYYMCGVYIARYKHDILMSRYRIKTGISVVLISEIIEVTLNYFFGESFHWVTSLSLAIGIWWLFNNVKTKKVCTDKYKITLLMYAVHPWFETIVFKLEDWFVPKNDIMLFLCFLVQPFLVTLIIMIFSDFTKKIGVYRWLTGETMT